ncbi:uncharacterized protein [Solanum tuberosum]|uniref:uncharacterized protein n=1 Tax=Solanum tuberosum TaxID=4113 RepID=UPI00073A1F14|nr:PREDICTED: uncharacterized protein LOC102584939 [Solanum tuberosum]
MLILSVFDRLNLLTYRILSSYVLNVPIRKKISHILTKEENQLENALSYLSLFRRIHNKNGMKFRTPSFPLSSKQWREVEGIEVSREMVTARLGLIHLDFLVGIKSAVISLLQFTQLDSYQVK